MQSIRNPEQVLTQALAEMQDHLRVVRPQVAAAMADERLLARRLGETVAESRAWEERAMLAVRAGDDGLARAALIRKAEVDERAEQWRAQHREQQRAVERLKDQLQRLQEKLEEARRNKGILVAKARRAMAQQAIVNTMHGLNGLSAFEALDRLGERIDRLEAETEAQLELAREMDGTDDRLAARFRELEQHTRADDALAELKLRMAAPPALPAIEDELTALKAQMALVPLRRSR
jgi:phage shock protein A